jgi:predicted nucleotidyltransferase
MDPAILSTIQDRLDRIIAEHDVVIPLAVESGSRAWGFPSPDSDYDCRFIFVRRPSDYLAIWRKKDVIETPLDETFDVNGWDLAKALGLLVKGNAVVIEWLLSPFSYRTNVDFSGALLDLAREVAPRDRIIHHYLHFGERQRRTYFGNEKKVRRKRIFYALRPAAAIRWLRLNPGTAIAPMDFRVLMDECEPPAAVSRIVKDLLFEKAISNDMGESELPREIAVFIDDEFSAVKDCALDRPSTPSGHRELARRMDLAEDFFARWVGALYP